MTTTSTTPNFNDSLSSDKRKKTALEYNNEGLRKYKQVDFDDAIADYTKAIELDPDLAAAYFNRGTVLYRLGLFEEGLKDLIKSFELDPGNPEFLEGLNECRRMYELTKNEVKQ